jgi:HSP20 family protein
MVETNQTGAFWPNLYEPFRKFGSKITEWLSPASEASSDDAAYRISIELPGVSEADVELQTSDNTLTVTGEKTDSREEKGDTWYFTERQYGAFRRTFRLPSDALADQAEATMKDGVLEVTVPRRIVEERKGQKIKINKG